MIPYFVQEVYGKRFSGVYSSSSMVPMPSWALDDMKVVLCLCYFLGVLFILLRNSQFTPLVLTENLSGLR